MTEPKVFCDFCLRWLEHDQRYCPLFPDVKPPYVLRNRPHREAPCGITEQVQAEKWTECVCLVHTCYDARELGVEPDPENAPTYRDFIP